MADQRTFRLRLTYVKRGRLALLSHLEVIRAIERGVRRAGLPFAVTQGFSPHMRIAFGSALPVGVGSTCELADVFLRDYVNPARAYTALVEAFPPNLAVVDAAYVEPRDPAVSVAFPVGVYEVVLDDDVRWRVPETIEVVRKKKTKTLVVGDYLVRGFEPLAADETPVGVDDSIPWKGAYRFALQALPTGSLRPDGFVHASLGLGDDEGLWSPASPVVALTRVAQLSAQGQS